MYVIYWIIKIFYSHRIIRVSHNNGPERSTIFKNCPILLKLNNNYSQYYIEDTFIMPLKALIISESNTTISVFFFFKKTTLKPNTILKYCHIYIYTYINV